MRVLLKLELDCDPDAAWLAVRSPSVMSDVAAPFTSFTSLEPNGFPAQWPEGEHLVITKALGFLPIGQQVIVISYPTRRDDVRIMRDTGWGITGPLALIDKWEHSLSVAPAANGKTLYRDQLRFSAGVLTPLLWPVYWAFWQWRGLRMRQLAAGWS
jgi:hypothetical protein